MDILKGYYTDYAYYGYDPKTGKYMIFSTEKEYEDWMKEEDNE